MNDSIRWKLLNWLDIGYIRRFIHIVCIYSDCVIETSYKVDITHLTHVLFLYIAYNDHKAYDDCRFTRPTYYYHSPLVVVEVATEQHELVCMI